jgi:hypothetical protein
VRLNRAPLADRLRGSYGALRLAPFDVRRPVKSIRHAGNVDGSAAMPEEGRRGQPWVQSGY